MRIFQITDGKPGHENQSGGLIAALGRIVPGAPIEVHRIAADRAGPALRNWLLRRAPAVRDLPPPDLLLGAGHRTHFTLLATRRRCGGRAVVLMKPSLPLSWFDLCIVPEHDRVKPRDNLLITRGVLNPMQAEGEHKSDTCLVLIGGPSQHAQWDDSRIVNQLQQLLQRQPKVDWILSTSRRTPDSFVEALRALPQSRLRIHLAKDTGPGWVAEKLGACARAWVSIDSVSMVYEALSAGVAVGILELTTNCRSRVIAGLEGLVVGRCVTLYSQWESGEAELHRPAQPFNEAERCARAIVERWPELIR